MRNYFLIALAGITLAASTGRAWAWNSIGHMAVAKLAYDQFSDGEKTRLFNLLKSHPHYKQYLAANRPDDISEVEWVIVRSSVWPDWVRPRQKDQRGMDVTRYSRGEEHYVNIPFIDPKDAEAFAGKTLIDPDITNILGALRQRCNDVRTRNAAPEDKAVAVCWIFHLIGDIHQPLHNVAYFSSNPAFAQGDLGGNKFGVKVNGRKWKLHAYWDDLLGEDSNYGDDSAEHQQQIYRKAMAVAESLRGLTLPEADKANLEKNTTFASWSQEGFELAKTFAYQKTDGSGVLEAVEAHSNGSMSDNAPEVGSEYDKKAHEIAQVRVVLAGRRLSDRMKALLAAQ
jgi:hypothetical protein